MAAELRVHVRGRSPARHIAAYLSTLVQLVGAAEDAELRQDRKEADRSEWEFTALAVGSLSSMLAPAEPRGGSDWSILDRVPEQLTAGFAHAEKQEGLPSRWTQETARLGRQLATRLGTTADQGMTIAVVLDGEEVRTAEVTRRSGVNLARAMRVTHSSIGSLTGVLHSVSTRRGKHAGLWTERDDRRVTIALTDEQLAHISSWLGRRVRVFGELSRNAGGQPLSLRADRITLTDAGVRLADTFGVAADFLEGRSPAEYLEKAGGWS